jgi:protein-glucosylgalactosylhydroxylysine glucosidase
MSTPINPPAVKASGQGDLPAYVSNGLVGLRVTDIPLLPGYVMVSGLTGQHPVVEVEAAAQAPYPVAGDIGLNGVFMTTVPHQARFIDQAYDFSNGELTTRFAFEAGGMAAQVEVMTVCSRQEPTLVLQETTVDVNGACDLTLRAMVDPSRVHGRIGARHVFTPGAPEPVVDGSLAWDTLGNKTRCGIAYVTEFIGADDVSRTVPNWGNESPLATDYALRAQTGRRYRLRQIASVVPSLLHNEPDQAATRLAARAADTGFDALRKGNRDEWRALWESRIIIDGADERWQAMTDAAFFYLNSSVHASAPSSTSMFGLAQFNDYHYYYGHVMWDIETFCLPPLLMLQPEAARSMLEYRMACLPAARTNAKLNGRQGVQFPWESGPERGEESSPGAGKASWYEDHVTPDVAYAFALGAHMTGDRRLIEDAGEVLGGVADWLCSRVSQADERFVMRKTMGIAERSKAADNDSYTLMASKVVLNEAIEMARRLDQDVAPQWEQVLSGIPISPSPSTGAILSHDGFNPGEEKGTTPGPLAGLFPFWYPVDAAVERATLDYYLDLAPGYIGSPMLSPLYGVWAAWAGKRALSLRLLEEGYARLVSGRFLQTLEMDPEKFPDTPRAGPFFANLGGYLMGLLFGMSGVRPGPGSIDTWPQRRVVLPDGWRSIEVNSLSVRRKTARLVARHGDERALLEFT